MEKLGIDQVVKVLEVLVEGGNVADKIAREPGGIALKVAHLSSMFDELMAMGSFNAAAFKAQVADLDDAEKSELVAKLKAKFDIADDQVEAKIEGGIALAVKVEMLVEEVIAFAKGLKAPVSA